MEQAMERNQNSIQQPTTTTTTTAYYQNKDIEDLIESNWILIKEGEIRVL
jgi:ribosomal silencing factor RsfS